MVDVLPPAEGGDRTEPVGLEVEMQRSYLDYAMSVIVGRALPDVRDGLKPVHRRVLYAMYDGGYRPDRGYFKCSRVVGDVMGNYHPHGDSSIYDTLVRLAQPWSLRYPLVDGQGNFGSPGSDPPAAMRYTESRLHQLAMEMVAGIDEDTVDMTPNYDGRSFEPVVLPSRVPNILINPSAGIAVGMATNIPPHNLREVGAAVLWALEHPEATPEELLEAVIERVSGPDFPTGALIVGKDGISDAFRTGRGSVRMRAVVDVEEVRRGTQLVVTELPYMVNRDMLAQRIAELADEGRLKGITNIVDESSDRTGTRLVIELRRDAVAKVVLNNLYKHTQLQDTFGVNMLALVDGVPRTLNIGQIISHYIDHQVDVIVRRTRYRLRKAEERMHILRAYLKALDALDAVIALIRSAESADAARTGLMELLDVDEVQAVAILDLQLRRLAALERQRILDEAHELETRIADLEDILANPLRQRQIISDELTAIIEKFGDERRTRIIPAEGDMSVEDLIAREDVVVTVTRGGYAKRTKVDLYRSQRRGGKGVQGATLREDDIVDHFFVTTTHHWLLFFTNKGRVYRAKAHELPEQARTAKGQHVANILAFSGDEKIAEVIALRDYGQAPYLVLATRQGLVKKSRLPDFDSNRSGGLVAINLREGDELIDAALTSADDDIIMVSRKAQAIRFHATDEQLRPMGRATSGVVGMRFAGEDQLLSMDVIRADDQGYLLTATEGGFAKRTLLSRYEAQGRGGKGVLTHKVVSTRGALVGALVVGETDQLFAITSNGGVIRTSASEVRKAERQTMGVRLMNLGDGVTLLGVARNTEDVETAVDEGDATAGASDGA
ncbi:MAG: gyrase, subunit [Mycobacterium sp.]|nr:gyrase, subunit [Mycobacterium sp.]